MAYISFENVEKIYQMGEVTIHAVDASPLRSKRANSPSL